MCYPLVTFSAILIWVFSDCCIRMSTSISTDSHNTMSIAFDAKCTAQIILLSCCRNICAQIMPLKCQTDARSKFIEIFIWNFTYDANNLTKLVVLSASNDEKQTNADYNNQFQQSTVNRFVWPLNRLCSDVVLWFVLEFQIFSWKPANNLVKMQSCHSFLVGLFLLLLIDKPSTIIASCQHQKCDHTVGPTKIVELVNLDSDFENGQINPWVEQSESGVKWRVENKILPWEPSGNVAPTPPNGSNYLRVDRGAALSFGVAVLRSQTFTLGSDIEVSFSFSFWIRSKWPQFTNLEVITLLFYIRRTDFV